MHVATSDANAVDVHGLRVRWETRGLASDPARRLFAGFAACAETGDADLAITIDAGARALPDASDFRPAFFQGNVRGLEKHGEFRLMAPAAEVAIAADGRRIEAHVDAPTLNERGFANTTLVIALAIALRQHGLFHMHAGALVRGDGRRVLVMGDSGAGKSTVTLALLDAGARPLGDDTLFLAERDGAPTLLAFARPFHLAPATAAAFPALPTTSRDANGKSEIALDALPGRAIDRMSAPDVVLFPVVTREATTRAVPIDAAEAFGQALRSIALVAVDGMTHKVEQLALLRALLANARAFELHLGADWLADPAGAAERLPWARGQSPL